MKFNTIFRLALVAGLVSVAACKKPVQIIPAKPGNVNFNFQLENNGTPISVNSGTQYTLSNGTKYTVNLSKFYINDVRLISNAGATVSAANHTLIDFETGKTTFALKAVPGDKYKSIVFNLGVNSDNNHTGAQEGDLDPSKGMIWDWSTGYIFFKHEGQFIDATGATKNLIYHYGTDKAFVSTITLPISSLLEINANNPNAIISLDLNKLYTGLDFNVDYNRQSNDAASVSWIAKLKANFPGAFVLKSIQ
jgi:hypothetical protein